MGSPKRLQTGENDRRYAKPVASVAGFALCFKKAVRTRPGNNKSRERSGGAHRAQPGPGRRGDARIHGGERVSRLKSGAHVCVHDPCRRHFDGRAARLQELVHLRKQHRADRRVRCGHALGRHLRASRLDHGRMVERLSVCAVLWRLRDRRHPRRHVQRASAAGPGRSIDAALSGGRRRGRSPQGRHRGGRGRRVESCRHAGARRRNAGLRRLCRHRRHANFCRPGRRLFSHWKRDHRPGFFALARTRRRRTADRYFRRPRDADRALHRLGRRNSGSNRVASRGRSGSRRCDDGLVASSSLHRRGCNRHRGVVVAGAPRTARSGRRRIGLGGFSPPACRKGRGRAKNRARLADRNRRAHQPLLLDSAGGTARQLSWRRPADADRRLAYAGGRDLRRRSPGSSWRPLAATWRA